MTRPVMCSHDGGYTVAEQDRRSILLGPYKVGSPPRFDRLRDTRC